MIFCPYCSNLLLLNTKEENGMGMSQQEEEEEEMGLNARRQVSKGKKKKSSSSSSSSSSSKHRKALVFHCYTCGFRYKPTHDVRITRQMELKRKQVDDVMGGEGSWDNVQKCDEKCPVCEYPQAYYYMVQIRSADEPMTVFYKCAKPSCGKKWRD